MKKFLTAKPPSQILILASGVVGYLLLAVRYRDYLGDFGDFVKAGALIWEHQNPYAKLAYVNSPVSAVIAFGLNKLLPFLFFPLFWQLLNLIGLFFFFKLVVRKDFQSVLPIVFAGLAFLNVTRALFGNGQVTGLVLGLFAVGLALAKNNNSVFLVMLPTWLALEVKPQLALGFVAILIFQEKIQVKRFFVLGSYVILSHAAVQLKFSGNINGLWIQKLLTYSSSSLKQGYEISYWKAVAIYSGITGPVRLLSTFFILLTLAFIIFTSIKGNTASALFAAILLPLQNTYLHLYDLVPLGILVILGVCVYQDILMLITFIIFLQFFPLSFLSQILIAVLFISLFLILNKTEDAMREVIICLGFCFGLVGAWFWLSKHQTQELQIIDALVVPASILVLINRRKFVNLFDSSVALK